MAAADAVAAPPSKTGPELHREPARMLGRIQEQTTTHCAHLAADPVTAAAESVSSVIAQAVLGEQRNEAAASS